MATYGRFETVDGLPSGARAMVSTARPASGGDAKYVVKAFQPLVEVLGEEGVAAEIERFIDAAEAQRRAGAAGAQYWAPVHEFGRFEGGAFYVTDHCQRSAEKLILGRIGLSSRALYAIVSAVVEGLREFKRICGRGHGNLKPTNVLIAGGGSLDRPQVALTDPALASDPNSRRAEETDLRAVGELIYQLVVQRPRTSWPVRPSAEWKRLGSKGEAWRRFCNGLLAPNLATGTQTLDEVADELLKLREGGLGLPSLKTVASVLIGLAMIAGAAYIFWTSTRRPPPPTETSAESWHHLCEEHRTWFLQFKRNLLDFPPTCPAVQQMKRAKDENVKLSPMGIDGTPESELRGLADKPPDEALTSEGHEEVLEALEVVRGVWQDLQDELRLNELGEYQQKFQARGWTKPAQELQSLIEKVKQKAGKSLVGPYNAILELQGKGTLGKIEQRWKSLQAAQGAVEREAKASQSKVLAKFGQYVRAELANVESIKDLLSRLEGIEKAAVPRRLVEFLRGPWKSSVSKASFIRDGEVPLPDNGLPTQHTFRLWMERAGQYAALADDPRPERSRYDGRVKGIQARIGKLPADHPSAGSLTQRLNGLKPKIDELYAFEALEKNERDIKSLHTRTEADLSRLEGDVEEAEKEGEEKKKAEEYVERIQELAKRTSVGSSGRLNKEWRLRSDRIAEEADKALKSAPARCAVLDSQIRDMRKLIQQLEADLPEGLPQAVKAGSVGSWRDSLEKAVSSEREKTFGDAIAAGEVFTQPFGGLNAPAWNGRKTRYRTWHGRVVALAGQIGKLEALLDGCYLLDEKPPGGGKTVRQIHAECQRQIQALDGLKQVAKAVAALTDRVGALVGIEAIRQREALAARAASDPAIETTRAAYLKLAALASPLWPATAAEEKQDLAVQKKLASLYPTIGDAGRRKVLQDELKQQGQKRLAQRLTAALQAALAESAARDKVLRASGDKILSGFGPFVQAERKPHAGDPAAELKKVEDLNRLAVELATFVQGDWQRRVDRAAFQKESKVHAGFAGTVTEAVLREWLKEVKQYYRLSPDPRGTPAQWDRKIEGIEKAVKALEASAQAQQARNSKAKLDNEVKPAIRNMWALSAIVKNRSAILDRKTQAEKALATVVVLKPPTEWLTEVAALTIASSAKVDAKWAQLRARLLSGVAAEQLKADPLRYAELQSKLEAVRSFLAGLAETMPGKKGITLPPDLAARLAGRNWQKDLLAVINGRREGVLDQAMRSIRYGQRDVPDPASNEFQKDWNGLRADFTQWMADAQRSAADLLAMEDRLDACCCLDDPPAPSLRSLHTVCAARKCFRDLAPTVAPVLDRVKKLVEIDGLKPGELRKRAPGLAKTQAAEVAVCAWSKLGKVADWPRTGRELEAEAELQRGVSKALAGLDKRAQDSKEAPVLALIQGRIAPLRKKLAAEGPRRWQVCMNHLDWDQAPEVRAALRPEVQQAFGVDAAKLKALPLLDERARFNILLYRAKQIDFDPKAQKAAAQRTAWVTAVRADCPKLVQRAEVADLLRRLQAAKDSGGAAAAATLKQVGPGAASVKAGGAWTPNVLPNGDIEYTGPLGSGKLRFSLVRPKGPNAKPCYLCTTEVPVSLFADALKRSGAIAAVREEELLPADINERRGPRAWGWGRKGIAISKEWLHRHPQWLGLTLQAKPERPSGDHPMQYVSPCCALYVARLLGCRLPTSAEWAAAFETVKGGKEPLWNRRDKSWVLQYQKIAALRKSLLAQKKEPPSWPHADSFRPEGAPADTGKPAVVGDDGRIWFAKVGAGPGPFHHLVGNVAEFVYDDAAAAKKMAASSPKEVRGFLESTAAQLRVIGASALSPPELKPDRAYAVAPGRTFSDVGLRLAFVAPGESLGAQLKRIFVQQKYLGVPGP